MLGTKSLQPGFSLHQRPSRIAWRLQGEEGREPKPAGSDARRPIGWLRTCCMNKWVQCKNGDGRWAQWLSAYLITKKSCARFPPGPGLFSLSILSYVSTKQVPRGNAELLSILFKEIDLQLASSSFKGATKKVLTIKLLLEKSPPN